MKLVSSINVVTFPLRCSVLPKVFFLFLSEKKKKSLLKTEPQDLKIIKSYLGKEENTRSKIVIVELLVEVCFSRVHKRIKHEVKESTRFRYVQTWGIQNPGSAIVQLHMPLNSDEYGRN